MDTSSPAPAPWNEPRPFPSEAPPPPFPLEVLPVWLADWVRAQSVAKSVPLDLFAALALGVLSIAAMRRIVVSPWAGWREYVNLYLVVVLPVGEGKSPAFRCAMLPVYEYERRRRASEAAELAKLVEEHRVADERLRKLRRKVSNTTSDGAKAQLKADYDRAFAEKQKLAPLREAFTLIADDVTPEALEKLLAQHGERIAIMSAEGGPFGMLEGRYSETGPNLELFLKCHVGDAHRATRIGRVGGDLAHPVLTLVVTLQPSFLATIIGNPTFVGRGVVGRCWIVRPDSSVGYRDLRAAAGLDVSRVDATYQARIGEMLDRASRSDSSDISQDGATVTLRADAVEEWLGWAVDTEKRLRPSGDLADAADWGTKIRGGALRIAGILHFAKHGGDVPSAVADPIDTATMRNALALAEYFTVHACRTNDGVGEVERFRLARTAWRWMRKKRLASVKPRDLQRASGKNVFRTADVARDTLETLAEYGYLLRQGGTMDAFDVHPTCAGPFPRETSDKTDKPPPASDRSDVSDASRGPDCGPPSDLSDESLGGRDDEPFLPLDEGAA